MWGAYLFLGPGLSLFLEPGLVYVHNDTHVVNQTHNVSREARTHPLISVALAITLLSHNAP